MNELEFQLQGLADPRLAAYATSPLPAWLWSTDGTRILWSNPVGARLFGADNAAALARRTFGPADPHRRQVAQLAGRLLPTGAVRLERLRGFGAAPGMLATCACARLDFPDGHRGVLIAADNVSIGRTMPLTERLQRLVQGLDRPVAAFARDGMLVGASDAARALLGFHDLFEPALGRVRDQALRQGRVEMPVGIGHMVLQRVGTGADVGLVALIEPYATPAGDNAAEIPSGETEASLSELPHAPPPAEAAPQKSAPDLQEASPYIAPVADEVPAETSEANAAPYAAIHDVTPAPRHQPAAAPVSAAGSSWHDEPLPTNRQHPLRFLWQMDREGRFSLGSDEFTRLIGLRTAAAFGRPWTEIAAAFGLDPEDRVLKAFATHETWSGITLNWPVDDNGRLPVELSGLPVLDRDRNFAGYRGFGVCRDLDALSQLEALRRYELASGPAQPSSSDIALEERAETAAAAEEFPQVSWSGADSNPEPDDARAAARELPEPPPAADLHQADLEAPVDSPNEIGAELRTEDAAEPPKNVLPFRAPGEAKPPPLTPVENSAFNELARQLSARLESQATLIATPAPSRAAEDVAAAPTAAAAPASPAEASASEDAQAPEYAEEHALETPPNNPPEWLLQPGSPPGGETGRDRALLDLMPVGVLIYRLDRLLYANPAFLARMGFENLQALEHTGGLDALYVEAGVSRASSTSGTGTPVKVSAGQPEQDGTGTPPAEARLYTISWDGDAALALIFEATRGDGAELAAAVPEPVVPEDVLPTPPSPAGQADAEELGAILDTAVEGILMFDAEGRINSCNRSAEALFGYDGDELVERNLADLFAPESRPVVLDYLGRIKSEGVASLLDHGRDALGRVRQGGLVPLSVTMGRTRADGPNFFAVFRDLSQARQSESELREAKRLAERAANAKADMVARISHELRTPLNAIIGFAEVMIGERFGALGNERYVEYMKDIRASGERVLSVINDLLDLSRIETGKLDLSFTSQNLNEFVESSVAIMQPQANRERIIIRSSLAHALPPVVADARALRQILLNLIGNSIHLANAGGQVIVSTALSDSGEAMLRVRDTGPALNDNEVAAAMEPFRTAAPSDQGSDGAGLSLSLTKALVEANRAKFQIKTGGRSGTLIEVVFSHAAARV